MDSIMSSLVSSPEMQKYGHWTREELVAELMSRDEKQAEFDRLKREYEHKVSAAYWAQGKNERGAGRKSKLTAEHMVLLLCPVACAPAAFMPRPCQTVPSKSATKL